MAFRLSSPAQRATMKPAAPKGQGEIPQDKTDLAGIDIFAFNSGKVVA